MPLATMQFKKYVDNEKEMNKNTRERKKKKMVGKTSMFKVSCRVFIQIQTN